MTQQIQPLKTDQLVEIARSLGASDACLIPSSDLTIDDRLAAKCLEPKCPNYGLSYSCPPYVKGPDHFRKLLHSHPLALVLRLIIPAAILLSWERIEVGRALHEIVARLESEAMAMGFSRTKAFAGDSCKVLFCNEHLSCRRIAEDGSCRHPDLARPSMSGFGLDVFEMIQSSGWETNLDPDPEIDPEERLSWVAGLVLLG